MSWNFMKTAVAVCMAAALAISCGQTGHKVVVSNDLDIDRVNETVEIPLSEFADVPVESLVVLNAEGEQVPYQIYTSPCGMEALLFQATVGPNAKAVYRVVEGKPEEFAVQAYSRYVPERLDDYAYENNVIAGRIYGPALESPRTYGADIWVKCTERLIIDEWFAKNDYHHNYGEGMDCYKVDNSLGGGAWAPVNSEGEPVIGDNYAAYVHVCDGPIRTEAVFEYDAVDVDGQAVSAKRIMSLDANSRFIKNAFVFSHEGPLTVALAAVKHNVSALHAEDNWIAFTEAASDSKDPERDGDISVGLVYVPFPDAEYTALENIGANHTGIVEHCGGVKPEACPKSEGCSEGSGCCGKGKCCSAGAADQSCAAKANCSVHIGYTGNGWSQGGIESAEAWKNMVADFALCVLNPLKVEVE